MTAHTRGIICYGRAVSVELAALLRWWGSELRGVASSLFNRASLQGTPQLRLLVSEQVVTVLAEDDPAVHLLRLSVQEADAAAARSAISAAGLPSRASVRIVLAADEILLCPLRLPALREPDLAAAIELQLERELPLPRAQVCVDWRAESRAHETSVTVAIARRSTIDALAAALRSWGWEVCGIGTPTGAEWQLLPQRTSTVGLSLGPRDRWLIALGVLLGFVYLATVAVQWAYERSSLAEELTLARQRSVQFAAQRKLLETEAEPIRTLQRIMSTADAIQILQSITRTVPMDTWLYRTQISLPIAGPATLELGGYGPSPTLLVDALEQHPDFERVELVAAAAGTDASGLSRVELKAHWRRADAAGAGQ